MREERDTPQGIPPGTLGYEEIAGGETVTVRERGRAGGGSARRLDPFHEQRRSHPADDDQPIALIRGNRSRGAVERTLSW